MKAKKDPDADEIPIFDFDPAEKLLNGQRAENLLRDPMLQAVFEAVANRYRQAWENAPRGDLETQQAAHYSLAALKDVISQIRAHLGSARLFEADLAARAARERQTPRYFDKQ